MPKAGEKLGQFQDCVAVGNLAVILAFRIQAQTGIRYRVVRADVDEGFRRSAVDVTVAALRKFREFDVVPFDASRLLASEELFHRTVDDAGLSELAKKLHQPAVLEPAGYRDFDERLAFYAFVFQRPNVWVAFIRQAYQVHVSGIHKLIAVFRQQRLTKPSADQRVLRFDDRFDLIVDQKDVYIDREEAFETLFVDRQAWQARVPAQIDLLVESGLPIKNLPELVAACQSNLNMMRKLQRIVDSGYLEQINIAKIERLVKEYKLSPTVISDGKLYFDSV